MGIGANIAMWPVAIDVNGYRNSSHDTAAHLCMASIRLHLTPTSF